MKTNILTMSTLLFLIILTTAAATNGQKAEKYLLAEPITTDGKILSRKAVLVKSAAFGIIEEIYVKPGDNVKPGDPIAKVKLIPDYEKVQAFHADVMRAKIEYKSALENFHRVEALFKRNLTSEAAYKDAETELGIKESQQIKAEGLGHLLATGKSRLGDEVTNMVYATQKGMVVSLGVSVGDFITAAMNFNQGTTIANIIDMQDLIFSSQIDEQNVDSLHVGKEIIVYLKNSSHTQIKAKIEFISYVAEEINGQTVFKYTASLITPRKDIARVGLSAQSSIGI
jgi:HlyD family secretion protein